MQAPRRPPTHLLHKQQRRPRVLATSLPGRCAQLHHKGSHVRAAGKGCARDPAAGQGMDGSHVPARAMQLRVRPAALQEICTPPASAHPLEQPDGPLNSQGSSWPRHTQPCGAAEAQPTGSQGGARTWPACCCQAPAPSRAAPPAGSCRAAAPRPVPQQRRWLPRHQGQGCLPSQTPGLQEGREGLMAPRGPHVPQTEIWASGSGEGARAGAGTASRQSMNRQHMLASRLVPRWMQRRAAIRAGRHAGSWLPNRGNKPATAKDACGAAGWSSPAHARTEVQVAGAALPDDLVVVAVLGQHIAEGGFGKASVRARCGWQSGSRAHPN